MKERFNRFMVGRYGVDDLSKFMLGFSVAMMVVNLFCRIRLLNTVVLILLVLVYFRMFSTNIQKRYAENVRYLTYKGRFFGFFGKTKRRALDLKTHHIYRCPSCRQKIRIPRGKGRIMITCPKCRTEFEKKS